jgi:hypothetical protein
MAIGGLGACGCCNNGLAKVRSAGKIWWGWRRFTLAPSVYDTAGPVYRKMSVYKQVQYNALSHPFGLVASFTRNRYNGYITIADVAEYAGYDPSMPVYTPMPNDASIVTTKTDTQIISTAHYTGNADPTDFTTWDVRLSEPYTRDELFSDLVDISDSMDWDDIEWGEGKRGDYDLVTIPMEDPYTAYLTNLGFNMPNAFFQSLPTPVTPAINYQLWMPPYGQWTSPEGGSRSWAQDYFVIHQYEALNSTLGTFCESTKYINYDTSVDYECQERIITSLNAPWVSGPPTLVRTPKDQIYAYKFICDRSNGDCTDVHCGCGAW